MSSTSSKYFCNGQAQARRADLGAQSAGYDLLTPLLPDRDGKTRRPHHSHHSPLGPSRLHPGENMFTPLRAACFRENIGRKYAASLAPALFSAASPRGLAKIHARRIARSNRKWRHELRHETVEGKNKGRPPQVQSWHARGRPRSKYNSSDPPPTLNMGGGGEH